MLRECEAHPQSKDPCPLYGFRTCASTPAAKSHLGANRFCRLFQPFHQIQIRQIAVVAEDDGFGVRSHENRADIFYAGRVAGHQVLPEGAAAAVRIDAIDVGGYIAGLIDLERAAVGAPGDGLLAGIDAGDRAWLSTIHRIEIDALVGADRGHKLRIRRYRK